MTGFDFIRQMDDERLNEFLYLIAESGFIQGCVYKASEDEVEYTYSDGCYQEPDIIHSLKEPADPIILDHYDFCDDIDDFSLPRKFVEAYMREVPRLAEIGSVNCSFLEEKTSLAVDANKLWKWEVVWRN